MVLNKFTREMVKLPVNMEAQSFHEQLKEESCTTLYLKPSRGKKIILNSSKEGL